MWSISRKKSHGRIRAGSGWLVCVGLSFSGGSFCVLKKIMVIDKFNDIFMIYLPDLVLPPSPLPLEDVPLLLGLDGGFGII